MGHRIILGAILLVILGGAYFFFQQKQTPTGKRIQQGEFLAKEAIQKEDMVIRVTKEGFIPESVTVKKGEKVVWLNESSQFSWPASDVHPTHQIYLEFDALEPFGPGDAWAFRFLRQGQWNFHDHLRANKKGTVEVLE